MLEVIGVVWILGCLWVGVVFAFFVLRALSRELWYLGMVVIDGLRAGWRGEASTPPPWPWD